MALTVPNGLAEIIATFGDIHAYIDDTGNLKPSWNTDYLAVAQLPFPISISWNKSISVQRITCHKLMVPIFEDTFNEIQIQGLSDLVKSFGGCFAFRPQRNAIKLSTHGWAISIDLNPETNQQGKAGDMPKAIIDVFASKGFEWGGIWPAKRRDGMHFQYATGY
jgi:hypothetical protein